MYQVKIEDNVETTREVVITNGSQMVDQEGISLEKQVIETVQVEVIDENGDISMDADGYTIMMDVERSVIDSNGNTMMEPILNDSGDDNIVIVNKPAIEISDEKQVVIDAEKEACQVKIDTYVSAQANQFANGGPGPVADIEIMKIVNENNSQFEVIFK